MGREELEELLDRYVSSLNADDPDQVRPLLDPGLVYEGYGAGSQPTGVESYVATVRHLRSTDPGFTGELTDRIIDTDVDRLVGIIVLRRSDPGYPTLTMTTIISVGADLRITHLREIHSDKPFGPRCREWDMGEVPLA